MCNAMGRPARHLRFLRAAWEGLLSHRLAASSYVAQQAHIGPRGTVGVPISFSSQPAATCSWNNWARGMHSSRALQNSTEDAQTSEAANNINESSSTSTYSHHVIPVSIEQLLEQQPLAAIPQSSSSNTSPNSFQQQQQQAQQLTEQLLSELFDSELEQRLHSAAAAAKHSSSSTTAAAVPAQQISHPLSGGFAITQSQQQHQQQQQSAQMQAHQPGVVPAAAPAYEAPNTTTRRPARISTWLPAGNAPGVAANDPWAPLPGPGMARRRLSSQLAQLLQQAGVPEHTAAAALAAAAAVGANTDLSQSSGSQQQQQRRSSAAAAAAGPPGLKEGIVDYQKVLNRLQAQQLAHVLEDCQAPTYGSKDLLINRIVLLLREQALLQQQQQQQAAGIAEGVQGLQFSYDSWLEGAPDAAAIDGAAAAPSPAANGPRQQQQSRGVNARTCQVAAAAAARQQLLESVLDVNEIGSWLMAARAQDVCIIDIRGRVGLHEQLVIGSGLSQRHTHACAEAVSWQIKDKVKQQVQQQQLEQRTQMQEDQQMVTDLQSSLNGLLPTLKVLGDASSDWAVLNTGSVVVHVLSERARRFYNLEGLWGGQGGRFIRWLEPEAVVETMDTIGRDMLV